MQAPGQRHHGYLDNQLMPVLIGNVLLFVLAGQINNPEFDLASQRIAFYGFMAIALLPVTFGFVMHIDSLTAPESPFNRHQSPLLITLLCAAAPGLVAWQFYRAGMLVSMLVFAAVALSFVLAAILLALRRRPREK